MAKGKCPICEREYDWRTKSICVRCGLPTRLWKRVGAGMEACRWMDNNTMVVAIIAKQLGPEMKRVYANVRTAVGRRGK